MRFFDLFTPAVDQPARRRQGRAGHDIGVVIGTSAVVVLVSLAIGLQISANERLFGIGDLTQIYVEPNFGDYGGGPGPIIVESVVGGFGGTSPPNQTLITDQSLKDLAAIPGVRTVIPRDWMQGEAMLFYNRLETYAGITGVGIRDLAEIDLKPQSGKLTLERGTAVIGMMVPMNFYNPFLRPGQKPPPPPALLHHQVKLPLIKWDNEANQIRKNFQIRVVGIIAESKGEADWSIYMPLEDVTAYNQWFSGRRVNRNRDGYPNVMVRVDDIDHVLDVAEQINALGYRANTLLEFVQQLNSFYTILQVIFGGVGAIALLVAAIATLTRPPSSAWRKRSSFNSCSVRGANSRDVLSVF